jgi:hypothetical protein
MSLALLLTVIALAGSARPVVWICNPGHSPSSAPSNCQRLHYLIFRFR